MNAGHALQRHGGEHAERADGHPGGAEQVGALLGRAGDDRPVGEDQLERGDLGRDAAEPAPVPCVPVEIAPDDRLRVDVTEVRHRQAKRVERGVELAGSWCPTGP